MVAISLVVLGMDFLGWLTGVRAIGEKMINPLTGGITSAAVFVVRPFHTLGFVLRGPSRITDLESRYAEALVRAERVNELEQENESLRKLLGSGALREYNYIPIKVLSADGELVLSAGSISGVSAGESVVDENNVLVGRVLRVSPWTSWTSRVGITKTSVPVVIGGFRVGGLLESENGKGVVQVEQADVVLVGDSVQTSGVKGEYVSGLLVGRVVEVEPESADIYKKVWVDPVYEVGSHVYLVRGGNQ